MESRSSSRNPARFRTAIPLRQTMELAMKWAVEDLEAEMVQGHTRWSAWRRKSLLERGCCDSTKYSRILGLQQCSLPTRQMTSCHPMPLVQVHSTPSATQDKRCSVKNTRNSRPPGPATRTDSPHPRTAPSRPFWRTRSFAALSSSPAVCSISCASIPRTGSGPTFPVQQVEGMCL